MDAVYINLDRSVRKREEFEQFNAGTLTYERFSAIDGLQLNPAQLIADGTISAALEYTQGALGCLMSHLALWKRAVAENRTLTVCEDDAMFNRDFVKVQGYVLNQMKGDFDFLLWGWNFDSAMTYEMLPGISACAATFDQARMRRNTERFKATRIVPTMYPLQRAYGLTCYTITPAGAKTLLKLALPVRPLTVFFPGLQRNLPNTGLDVVLSSIYPKIKAFVSVPPLVITANDNTRSTTLRAWNLDDQA